MSREQDDEFRRAERQWQNELGHTLLDLPYQTAGSAAVFTAQWERIRAALAGAAGCLFIVFRRRRARR